MPLLKDIKKLVIYQSSVLDMSTMDIAISLDMPLHVVVLGKFSPRLIGTLSGPDQTLWSWSQSGIFPKMWDCLVSSLGNHILPEMVQDLVWTRTTQLI